MGGVEKGIGQTGVRAGGVRNGEASQSAINVSVTKYCTCTPMSN